MRKVLGVLLVLTVFLSFVHPCVHAEESFQLYNPDGDKYVFTRDLILSLGYYKRVAERLDAEVLVRNTQADEVSFIRTLIENRTKDNTEIRIARNYLSRYADSLNGLIRQVTQRAIAAYDVLLSLSAQERRLWQEIYQMKTSGQSEGFDEEAFVTRQIDVARQKKEAGKDLLTAAGTIKFVILSQDRCESEICNYLALTQEERFKLTAYLDAYARDNYRWGLQEGQTTLEAAVAVIREVLEDPYFVSRDKEMTQ